MECRGTWYITLLHLYIIFIGTEAVCPSGWYGDQTLPRLCYKATSLSSSYILKEEFCNNEGGHLASVHSSVENEAIRTLFQPSDDLYLIGLTDKLTEGTWVYSDSTQYKFKNWYEGEPNDSDGNEDCVEIKDNGKWNDVPCEIQSKGICRRDSLCTLPEINRTVLGVYPVTEVYHNGTYINFFCADGFMMEGPSRAMCLESEWEPQNKPICKVKQCTVPRNRDPALRTRSEITEYKTGAHIEYYCTDGFKMNGDSRVLCHHGLWVPANQPQCEAKSCAAPFTNKTEIMINALSEEYKHGSSVDIYCAESYVLKGNSSSVCLYGEWIPPTPPVCEALAQEDDTTGLPLIPVIGILILLIIIISACIIMYKLRTVLKSHRSPPSNSRSNEGFPMSNYHKPTLRCSDGFELKKVDILEQIDTGMFGPICKANAIGLFKHEEETTVQIVFLADKSSKDNKKQFRSMVEAYGSMELHPHVVAFYTYSIEVDNMFLILEYPTGGNLKEYLQNGSRNVKQPLSDSVLLTFALQVLMGLDFISSKNCVHMNLKASRVLLNHDLVCKISDFCPVDYSTGSNIYITLSEDHPSAKWMAPETIRSNIYTSKSNIWSFGVVLWEIMTSGLTPYEGMKNKEVLEFVTADCKLPRPQKQGLDMYATMMKCWAVNASYRPDFHDLLLEVEKALGYCEEYDAVDEDPEYGNATNFRRHKCKNDM